MKSNLILKKFKTNSIPGTMNQKEIKTFFGSKMLYIEDIVKINNDSIKFSQTNNGFQYYDKSITNLEIDYSENISDLKNNNHTISLINQNDLTLTDNTNWKININGVNILKDYLFFKIKQQRVFKNIYVSDVLHDNINNSIYEYITLNVLNRYKLDKIEFYVQYYDINKQTVFSDILLQYNPKFNVNVYKKENLINMTIVGYDPHKFNDIIIQYNQSKPSTQFSFNYYFDLIFNKI